MQARVRNFFVTCLLTSWTRDCCISAQVFMFSNYMGNLILVKLYSNYVLVVPSYGQFQFQIVTLFEYVFEECTVLSYITFYYVLLAFFKNLQSNL